MTAAALILLLLPAATPAGGSSDRSPYAPLRNQLGRDIPGFSLGDTLEITAHRRRLLYPGEAMPLDSLAAAPDPARRRRHVLSMMLRPRVYERSPIGRIVLGAGQLAGTGAALGGAGMVGGLWGEKTTGYLMGAGAVLGALWGGTIGSDDPGLRFGIEVEPDPGALPVREARDPEDRE